MFKTLFSRMLATYLSVTLGLLFLLGITVGSMFQQQYIGEKEGELRREAEEIGITIEGVPAAQRRLTELKNRIRALGAVNVAAVVEYKEVSERYTFMKAQTDDVEKSKAELLKLIDDLTRRMQTQFTERFSVINEQFGRIFKDLFGGGSASLSFTDEGGILNSGVEVKVHPPGKIVSHIELFSCGEKA